MVSFFDPLSYISFYPAVFETLPETSLLIWEIPDIFSIEGSCLRLNPVHTE